LVTLVFGEDVIARIRSRRRRGTRWGGFPRWGSLHPSRRRHRRGSRSILRRRSGRRSGKAPRSPGTREHQKPSPPNQSIQRNALGRGLRRMSPVVWCFQCSFCFIVFRAWLIFNVLLNPSADVSPQCAERAFGRRVSRSKSDKRAASLDDLSPNANWRDSVVEAHGISGACRRAVVVEQNQLSRANAIAWPGLRLWIIHGVAHLWR